jgi:hypothetical protein
MQQIRHLGPVAIHNISVRRREAEPDHERMAELTRLIRLMPPEMPEKRGPKGGGWHWKLSYTESKRRRLDAHAEQMRLRSRGFHLRRYDLRCVDCGTKFQSRGSRGKRCPDCKKVLTP